MYTPHDPGERLAAGQVDAEWAARESLRIEALVEPVRALMAELDDELIASPAFTAMLSDVARASDA